MNSFLSNIHWVRIAILLSFLISGVFFLIGLDLYSVALFEGDTWHVVDAAFSDASLFEGFLVQHGPHRMGGAFVLHRFAVAIGYEYGFVHSYIQGGLWLGSGWMALQIVKSIRGRYAIWDVIIPIIFLNTGLLLSCIYTPYIHGLTPFLTLALIRAMQWSRSWKRTVLILIVLFVSLFSFNANLLVVAFFLVALVGWFKSREKEWTLYITWILILGGVLMFTTNTSQFSSTLESGFNLNKAFIYLVELSSLPIFFTAQDSNFYLALFFLLFVLMLWLSSTFMDVESKVPFGTKELLIAVIVIFWVVNTFTRWSSGEGNAHAARYYPMVPLLLFSLYLAVESFTLQAKRWSRLAVVLLVLFSWNSGRDARFELERKKYEFDGVSKESMDAEWMKNLHPYPERVNLEENIKRIGNQ